jgi:ADP-heptose:LPS heptosyltransferase
MLMLTSILPLVHQRFPSAAVDIACSPISEEILRGNPYVRKLIPLQHLLYNRNNCSFWRKLTDFVGTLSNLIVAMHRERYDLCLNLRDAGGDLILWARIGGCRCVIGHDTGGCGALLDKACPWEEARHEVEHYLEVLQLLDIHSSLNGLSYELYPDENDRELVRELMAKRISGPFVVLHPGCGDPRKLMPAAFWASIASQCEADVTLVMTGSATERRLYDDIAAQTKRSIVCLTGLLSIRQLFLLYRNARNVYALDSLSAHVAACAGVPATIFWPEFHDVSQWRPLSAKIEIVEPGTSTLAGDRTQ